MPNTAILLCPYNHSQQLKGRANWTSTYPRDPTQEEENDYKRGVKRNRSRGDPPPQYTRSTRKSSSDHAEDQFSLVNLAHEEHHDDCCPYTKTKLFSPLSTNLLYQAHWSKVLCILGLAWKTWPYIYIYIYIYIYRKNKIIVSQF